MPPIIVETIAPLQKVKNKASKDMDMQEMVVIFVLIDEQFTRIPRLHKTMMDKYCASIF
ncbi:hypothetical protein [Candidatus Kuenenia stuttgartiensis]|jgi:hypothetical protein|uniref:hypothetical protein n=1 Tax=Candidatus Kuenenia TaxID=380738 RepID=UPI0002F65A9C|nr:hypothetical protein [Candidatus Kuenenia stuttgartiensis]GJQ48810.1 MAG: hypothetical protein HKUEN01_11960 [Candidatus Kuenenia stuttgartiensis]